MSTNSRQSRIGITLGDCAGIGPEIVELALKSDRLANSAEYHNIGKYPNCTVGKPTAETARPPAAAPEKAVTPPRPAGPDALMTGPAPKTREYERGMRVPGQTE